MSTNDDAGFAVRRSTIDDLPRMDEIFVRARDFMAQTGNTRQWGATGWPPESLLRRDIADGHSYVCEHDGRVVGTFFFICGPHVEPTYETIEDGEWAGVRELGEAGNTYGVVHRLAGDGSVPGIGTHCLSWAYEQCSHLRVDTHPDNRVMRRLLGKLGFVRCGIIHVAEDDDPRIAFERLPDATAGTGPEATHGTPEMS
jgi:GNAT superfamily N-acetyltransferase